MLFSLALVASLAPKAQADSTLEDQFGLYKARFGKSYADLESERHALAAFNATLQRLSENANSAHGINKFSDMFPEEFAARYLTRKARSSNRLLEAWKFNCTACGLYGSEWAEKLKSVSDFDWVKQGAVTRVKDQGQCGSCWSFGTTGDIEGVTFLATKKLISLSEQQLVSCDTKSDEGCNGGLQEDAFDYVIKTGGLVTEASYPYTSGRGKSGKCDRSKASGPYAASISKWSQVAKSASGEDDIRTALLASGPITIGINAGPMQDYVRGIDNPKRCNVRSLDHAVLVVGFGTENGVDYWKIKNSWNTDWGEEGYYRIVRGENKCGVAEDAVHSAI